MSDFMSIYAAKLPEFEGKSPWPYLDTHLPPLVTVGIGCYTPLPEFVMLPFYVDGQDAPNEEAKAEHYRRVQGMKPGMDYAAYEYTGCLMLPEQAITDLCMSRLRVFTGQLQGLFQRFDSFPVSGKVGLLEMVYGLGMGSQVRKTGLYSYPKFISAVNAEDWKVAAAQSGRNTWNPAYDKRNAWVREQFLEAASR